MLKELGFNPKKDVITVMAKQQSEGDVLGGIAHEINSIFDNIYGIDNFFRDLMSLKGLWDFFITN